jgi:hypothetical protein
MTFWIVGTCGLRTVPDWKGFRKRRVGVVGWLGFHQNNNACSSFFFFEFLHTRSSNSRHVNASLTETSF